MSGPNETRVTPCQTCASLTNEAEMVVAKLAARMGCAFVCKECGREAQIRQAAQSDLLAALRPILKRIQDEGDGHSNALATKALAALAQYGGGDA